MYDVTAWAPHHPGGDIILLGSSPRRGAASSSPCVGPRVTPAPAQAADATAPSSTSATTPTGSLRRRWLATTWARCAAGPPPPPPKCAADTAPAAACGGGGDPPVRLVLRLLPDPAPPCGGRDSQGRSHPPRSLGDVCQDRAHPHRLGHVLVLGNGARSSSEGCDECVRPWCVGETVRGNLPV